LPIELLEQNLFGSRSPPAQEVTMVVVTALYPNEPGSSFDYDYYLNKHVPLVRERWRPMGLENQR
jgi:hypothetical protein